MREIINYKLSSISWISTLNGDGRANHFYEPESIEELTKLCQGFYKKGVDFDLIGHTSNTLYTPNYVCEHMVSTRRLKTFEIKEDCIVCQCGASVRQLSLALIESGIKGLEGTIDLPGTIASAIYGHATCYGTDVSKLLVEATVLTSDGKIIVVKPEWFEFSHRSSVLKRGEKRGVILTVVLRRENGNSVELKALADQNHAKRHASQPEAKNSLGSIFKDEGRKTLLHHALVILTKPYGVFLKLVGNDKRVIEGKRKHLIFKLLKATDVEPYICAWNWYQWKDELSHELFWKYVRIHKMLFSKSEFEIEIKK